MSSRLPWLREPAADGEGLVAGGVVEPEVHAQMGGNGLVDPFDELQKLGPAGAV